MPASQYLPFGTGGVPGTPNTLSYAAYAALTTLIGNGFQTGVAESVQINTVLRQASVGVSGLAKFVADNGPSDVLDNGNVAEFATKLKAALDALYFPKAPATGNMASNGWAPLPGGLILQWGGVAFADVPGNVTGSIVFASSGGIAFPTACFRVFTDFENTTFLNVSAEITAKSTTGFSYNIKESGSEVNSGTMTYLAIGH